MIRLTVKVEGAEEYDLLLSRIGERAANLRPPLREILVSLRFWMARTFKTEGGYPGPAWARLTSAYDKQKRKQFGGRGILVRRGILMRSLVGKGTGSIGRVGSRGLVYGTQVPHAIFHQEGTRKMKARPPLRFIERDVRRWIRILQTWAFPSPPTEET